jgi:hypothetical protein
MLHFLHAETAPPCLPALSETISKEELIVLNGGVLASSYVLPLNFVLISTGKGATLAPICVREILGKASKCGEVERAGLPEKGVPTRPVGPRACGKPHESHPMRPLICESR